MSDRTEPDLSTEDREALTRVLNVAKDYESIVHYESNKRGPGERLALTASFKALRYPDDFDRVARLIGATT